VLLLTADVGEAMADYLLHARPTSTSRHLLVTLVAPVHRSGDVFDHGSGRARVRPRRLVPVRAARDAPRGGV